MALWDRLLRLILGFVGLIWAVAGGPSWGYLSIYLLATAAWGWCLVYALFRIRSAALIERPLAPPD